MTSERSSEEQSADFPPVDDTEILSHSISGELWMMLYQSGVRSIGVMSEVQRNIQEVRWKMQCLNDVLLSFF